MQREIRCVNYEKHEERDGRPRWGSFDPSLVRGRLFWEKNPIEVDRMENSPSPMVTTKPPMLAKTDISVRFLYGNLDLTEVDPNGEAVKEQNPDFTVNGSAAVTEAMLKQWGVSTEEIFDIAIKNAESEIPSVYNIADLLNYELFEGDNGQTPTLDFESLDLDETSLICVKTQKKDSVYGAFSLLTPSMNKKLKKLSTAFRAEGMSLYLLPSSIHEWLISSVYDVGLVDSVNNDVVDLYDVLCDKGFLFTGEYLVEAE